MNFSELGRLVTSSWSKRPVIWVVVVSTCGGWRRDGGYGVWGTHIRGVEGPGDGNHTVVDAALTILKEVVTRAFVNLLYGGVSNCTRENGPGSRIVRMAYT